MSQSLPPHPSLEALKKQAKQLVAACKSGDASICSTLRLLKRFTDASDADILSAKVSLTEAQFALAMNYGFESWAKLKAHVESGATGPARSATVFGQITNAATGGPIEGVDVRVQTEDTGVRRRGHALTHTDAQGHYECHLEWNESDRPDVTIQCRHEAYEYLWEDVSDRDADSGIPRRLDPGERLQRDIQLTEGFTLDLHVEDDRQRPAQRAVVRILEDDGVKVLHSSIGDYVADKDQPNRYDQTDSQGRLRIEGLSANPNGYTYVLEIEHIGCVTYRLHDIEKLPREGAVVQLTVRLEKGRRLTGRVISADTGRPIGGANVGCQSPGYGKIWGGRPRTDWAGALSGPDGRFEITGLPDAPAKSLAARHANWPETEVPLADPPAEPIIVRMRPGRSVTGEVFDRLGRPAVDGEVRAVQVSGPDRRSICTSNVDADGRFRMNGLPADQRVWLLATAEVNGFTCLGFAELGADGEHVVFDGRERVDVAGRVVDSAGETIQARVSCHVHAPPHQSGWALSESVQPDQLGHFRATLPRNGTVVLRLTPYNGMASTQFFSAVSVTTRDGRPDRPLTIQAGPAYSLAIRSLDARSDRPIARASVIAMPVDWLLLGDRISDENGEVLFTSLPPCEVSISVGANGYQSLLDHRVTVSADEEIVLRLMPQD